MGLQHLEDRSGTRRRPQARRSSAAVLLGLGVLALSGCANNEATRLGMPDPITVQGRSTLELWQGAWIAALATGLVVWGLIGFAVVRFRRRSDDEIPVQTRYNLPLEIFYTIFPVIMVIVFFSHTVRVQNIALDDSPPDNNITVVGQQWQWSFNYPDSVDGRNVYEVGAGNYIPTLYLPVDQTTRFTLHSPDVIHDFGVPGFLIKMDVIPGQENQYQVTPTTIGEYKGKCYEFCGVSHSRMLFNVKVVTEADYQAYLQQQAATGNISDEPLLGGSDADTQAGLEETTTEEGTQ